jgi:hypothetical protein
MTNETQTETTLNTDTNTTNTKPVKAKVSTKGTAHAARKGKVAKATKPLVVKPATKGNVDPIMGSYPNLKKWPKACGAAPSRELILTARALAVGRDGSKRELATAAYLRPDAGQYHTGLVAAALQVVLGGKFNPIMNAVNHTLYRSMQVINPVIKAKVDGGTSYRIELNGKGKAKVARYMAAEGLASVEASRAPDEPRDANQPPNEAVAPNEAVETALVD